MLLRVIKRRSGVARTYVVELEKWGMGRGVPSHGEGGLGKDCPSPENV